MKRNIIVFFSIIALIFSVGCASINKSNTRNINAEDNKQEIIITEQNKSSEEQPATTYKFKIGCDGKTYELNTPAGIPNLDNQFYQIKEFSSNGIFIIFYNIISADDLYVFVLHTSYECPRVVLFMYELEVGKPHYFMYNNGEKNPNEISKQKAFDVIDSLIKLDKEELDKEKLDKLNSKIAYFIN